MKTKLNVLWLALAILTALPASALVYGPDKSGTYGGAQGEGGLDNRVDENGANAYLPLNDYFGDVLGELQFTTFTSTSGASSPTFHSNNLTLGGYGPEPGTNPGTPVTGKPGWRGRYPDTGDDFPLYYFGARYYDPLSGRFLSQDPLGHDGSRSLYDYCNGDPVNGLDPDGRLGKNSDSDGSILSLGQENLQIQNGIDLVNLAPMSEDDQLRLQSISALVNSIPLLGGLTGITEGISGHDIFTGAELDAGQRYNAFYGGLAMTLPGAALEEDALANVGRIDTSLGTRFSENVQSTQYSLDQASVAAEGGAAGKIPWGDWSDYSKVTVNGNEYAQVGDRLYTQHAVERMTPSGLGTAARAGGVQGRSVSPNIVEDVLTNSGSTQTPVLGPNGEARILHQLGTVQVVTEGDIVITIITK